MRVTRAVLLGALVAYVLLWALALAGASSLVAPLTIPLVLAVLVALGVWLQRYLGLAPRRPRFEEPPREEPPQP